MNGSNNNGVGNIQQANNSQQATTVQTNQNTNGVQGYDDELLKAFVGDNYEKITKQKFSIPGFFFTSAYMLYRKMFLFGLIEFLVVLIISSILRNFLILLIFNIVIGLAVNKIYLFYAKRKISKIKSENAQKDVSALKSICEKEGGTSLGIMFMGLVIELVISMIMVFLLSALGYLNVASGSGGKVVANGTYDGTVVYDESIKMKNEFKIEIPHGFKNKSKSYNYEYAYSADTGVFNRCSFNLYAPKGFSDPKKLINQVSEYNSKYNPGEISDVKISGINWNWFYMEDDFGMKYFYTTKKKNKVYMLEYEVQNEAPTECEDQRQELLESIKIK